MAPSVDGTVHHFEEHGLYDGLFLMRDEESGTFWDHLTGEALYGPLVGTKLEVSSLVQTTAGQALQMEAGTRIALSNRQLRQDTDMAAPSLLMSIGGWLSGVFNSTIEQEDDRRPTMDLGIGIWLGDQAKYYPYDEVVSAGRALIDEFDGRRVLVYLDPHTFVLSAAYVDGDEPEWYDRVLRLTDGTHISEGVMYDAGGARLTSERPLQVFTRWYGFSLTFPGTEIFGDPR